MSSLSPGDRVWRNTVSGGGPATVLSVRGSRVKLTLPSGDVVTTKRTNVRPFVSPGVRAPQRVTRTPDVEGGHLVTTVPKTKTWRSRAYLDHVRSYPCCNCGAPPRSEAHHWGPHGMGQKCSDALTAPLCSRCHRFYHDRGALPEADCTRGEDTVETLTRGQLKCLRAWVERREGGGE